jgi:hypothetical protein
VELVDLINNIDWLIADKRPAHEIREQLLMLRDQVIDSFFMDNLSTYLNDHLAGSVAALNMIDRLVDIYEGKPLAQFFRDLRAEIAADQAKLQGLVEKLDKKNSAIRKAGGWIAEKLSRAKIRPGESRDGEMGLYLALESLVLGITAKCALWRGLEIATDVVPELRGLDYAQLQKRAREQCDRVETKRLELAPAVFKPRKQ